MGLVVHKIQSDDNMVDYTQGFLSGSIQATTDFKLGKREANNDDIKTEYRKGFHDGYHNTYLKCQERLKDDSILELLKQEIMI